MTDNLRFLMIKINNHPLLEDNTNFSLVTQQRVFEDDTQALTKLFGRNWTNDVNLIVGKNATGKTTIMKFMIGALELLTANKSISQTHLAEVLVGDDNINFETYFYGTDGFLYGDFLTLEHDTEWRVKDERILQKKAVKSLSKKQLLDFTNAKVIMDRSKLNEAVAAVLSSDDALFKSIIALKKYRIQPIFDTLFLTNYNTLATQPVSVPTEILEYLDSSVEYLKVETTEEHKLFYRLKFKSSNREITDANFSTIELFLSSGTAKGITLYQQVIQALVTGGILFIDELENHFNHAIVRTFIEYFANPKININGATIIFSTHYAEFLDDLERSDQIYIARRDRKIYLTRYSDTNIRVDLSKSEVFMADNLGGTSPSYKSYLALKKRTMKVVRENSKR